MTQKTRVDALRATSSPPSFRGTMPRARISSRWRPKQGDVAREGTMDNHPT
jgi:hypothetical protein